MGYAATRTQTPPLELEHSVPRGVSHARGKHTHIGGMGGSGADGGVGSQLSGRGRCCRSNSTPLPRGNGRRRAMRELIDCLSGGIGRPRGGSLSAWPVIMAGHRLWPVITAWRRRRIGRPSPRNKAGTMSSSPQRRGKAARGPPDATLRFGKKGRGGGGNEGDASWAIRDSTNETSRHVGSNREACPQRGAARGPRRNIISEGQGKGRWGIRGGNH